MLTQAEVDDLPKRKWKDKWEVPAADIQRSKWVGTGDCFLKQTDGSSDLGLKLKLYKHWLELCKSSGGNEFHSSRRRRFFSLCNSYRDILHCNKRPFYVKGLEEDSSTMDAYIMHALNHVFKTRDLVTKNEAKLAKLHENNKEEAVNGDGFLDHGFTRPKGNNLVDCLGHHFSLGRPWSHNAFLGVIYHRSRVPNKNHFFTIPFCTNGNNASIDYDSFGSHGVELEIQVNALNE